jgi:hypothetical protein
MAKEKPDATGMTNMTPGSCVDVPCVVKHKIVYLFNITSKRNLNLHYAFAINGKIDPQFKANAKVLACGSKSGLVIYAEQGSKIELYLNSDAHPDFRKEPVYAFTVGDAPAEIHVTEKKGAHADTATIGKGDSKESKDAKTGATVKTYVHEASLTGDIWLTISHKYSVAEARNQIPATTIAEIRDAVLKFYDGTLSDAKPTLTVSIPRKEGNETLSVSITPDKAGSLRDVSFCVKAAVDVYQDMLTRVHPKGFVALLEAAREAGVSKIHLTSTWRPMTGSIAHRAGLGLDVNYLDKDRLNRRELRPEMYKTGDVPDTSNVSDEEKKLFAAKLKAEKEAAEAQAQLDQLLNERDKLVVLRKSASGKVDPLREAALPEEIAIKKENARVSAGKSSEANKAWNDERDKHEPPEIKSFRSSLHHCECVKQIFDPWYVQSDTHNDGTLKANTQSSDNEQLHANHLHITVRDERLPL